MNTIEGEMHRAIARGTLLDFMRLYSVPIPIGTTSVICEPGSDSAILIAKGSSKEMTLTEILMSVSV